MLDWRGRYEKTFGGWDLEYRETELVELKKSTSESEEAMLSIVAILNKHKHGELYFGIKNNGEVVGQDVSEKTIRKVSQKIASSIRPNIFPIIEKQVIEGKDCLVVIFEGIEHTYYANGKSYIRVGDEDRLLSPEELEKRILEKNRQNSSWDMQYCSGASVEDISSEKLELFLTRTGLQVSGMENSLAKLNLYAEGQVRNAAIILFGENPNESFPSAKLRCALFGTEDTTVTLDMKDFVGDIFDLIERAEGYVLQNIRIGMEIDGLQRRDVPEISKEALREAIINAFAHRDYREYDSVNIAVFKNRVEIRSPGLLYGGLTVEQIRREMISERRNELICDILHRIHFVEKWGRGIPLILSKESETEFKEVGTHFIVSLKRKPYAGEERDYSETTRKLPENYPKATREVFDIIAEEPDIARAKIAERLGLTVDGVKYHIKKLEKEGLIKRTGAARGGHWEVL